MLPRFSKVTQRSSSADTALLQISWGRLTFAITMSKTPLENDFDDTLYPHQPLRNLIAIFLLLGLHLMIAYFLLNDKVEPLVAQGDKKGELIFLDLQAGTQANPTPAPPEPVQPKKQQKTEPKKKQQRRPARAITKPRLASPSVKSPTSITSQLETAREKRRIVEQEAVEQNQQARAANAAPSDDDVIMARIKNNIKAATYNRVGKNGIFQITSKGVQTGRFTFRGWDDDPRESTWKSYEVDAGVGGDVELALVRRMIEIIRQHYSGDFNWESQRLNKVVILSARPADTASLEKFLRKEFFDSK